jgi:hypothetical protein
MHACVCSVELHSRGGGVREQVALHIGFQSRALPASNSLPPRWWSERSVALHCPSSASCSHSGAWRLCVRACREPCSLCFASSCCRLLFPSPSLLRLMGRDECRRGTPRAVFRWWPHCFVAVLATSLACWRPGSRPAGRLSRLRFPPPPCLLISSPSLPALPFFVLGITDC